MATDPRHVDLLLLPHFDLHMLTSPNNLALHVDVVMRTDDPDKPGRFKLVSVRKNSTFAFFSPHVDPPDRLRNKPTVNKDTGLVTAATPGVYLFQVRVVDNNGTDTLGSLVGRLQVHSGSVTDWWFGNDSITTAKDPELGHAEPTIYASFTPDPATGTDLVGDITGHGYVQLTPDTPATVDVVQPKTPPDNPTRRLRGVVETKTDEPVKITGTLPGKPPQKLDVHVVDYATARQNVVAVPRDAQTGANPAERFNILFLAEGFRQQDAAMFNNIVAQAREELFNRPRHEPYPLLRDSFDVFRAFEPSRHRAVTCGYRVQDNPGGIGVGHRIPANVRVKANTYSMAQLVRIVGLPMQGESRSTDKLLGLWRQLPGFEPGLVDNDVIAAWRAHQSKGITQARDTFFGTCLGGRLADGSAVPGLGEPPVTAPPADQPGAALNAFISRLYDFYNTAPPQSLRLDPRRHPPELYANHSETNPQTSLVRYLAGLQLADGLHSPIGPEWVPDPAHWKRSKGLVAIVTFDFTVGGENINSSSAIVMTLADNHKVDIEYNPVGSLVLRRIPPEAPSPLLRITDVVNFDRMVSTLAHEFGHSFNLGDEYEDRFDDGGDVNALADVEFDNLSRLGFLRLANQQPPDGRQIDPNKVKWFALPLMQVSGRLVADSVASTSPPGGIEVRVPRADFAKWLDVAAKHLRVSLRNFAGGVTNRQLPLSTFAVPFLPDLRISGTPDPARSSFVLVANPPLANPPTFRAGSAIYVPLTELNGRPRLAVQREVADFLAVTHAPMNRDTDRHNPRQDPRLPPDDPVAIPGVQLPRHAYQLVGVYEGGNHFAGGHYRATGDCKMRDQNGVDARGQFCFVCKWLIVNFVDPNQHAQLHRDHYPR